jgi:hypothetical protein
VVGQNPFRWGTRCSHALVNGTIPRTFFGRAPTLPAWRFAKSAADSSREAARTAEFEACAISGDHIAVMLHLRSLYVSKAAILTIPVLSVPVENRSPA